MNGPAVDGKAVDGPTVVSHRKALNFKRTTF